MHERAGRKAEHAGSGRVHSLGRRNQLELGVRLRDRLVLRILPSRLRVFALKPFNPQPSTLNRVSIPSGLEGESIPVNPYESTREWLERQGIKVSTVPKGARIITAG